eukprot:2964660-Rhodomonas_salina.1
MFSWGKVGERPQYLYQAISRSFCCHVHEGNLVRVPGYQVGYLVPGTFLHFCRRAGRYKRKGSKFRTMTTRNVPG